MSSRKKISQRCLHLLEVLLVTGLLALAGGAMFWRIDLLIGAKCLQNDVIRLKSLLLHAKALAINTHSDIRLELISSKKGWKAHFQTQEELLPSLLQKDLSLSHSLFFLDDAPVQSVTLDFFSSGLVLPKGTIKIQKKEKCVSISLSELFGQTGS